MKLSFRVSFAFTLFFIVSTQTFGQTTTPPPIWKSLYFSIEITELSNGQICFYYQDPAYNHIVETISFCCENKSMAIQLFQEVEKVLLMPKTSKDSQVEHSFDEKTILRLGSSQKWVSVDGMQVNKKAITQILSALRTYQYIHAVNK